MLYSELQCSEAIHKAVEQMGFADLAGQAVLEELRKVELNTLTPIEAMNLLYGWKAKLDG